ncbi:ribosomal RNA small subunit methyltransferase G [Betaproteobacteria bacterium]|nr:ribosomal RNA small subunit methyltransferase G [Betaproteobacteria bacterium]GHU43992.1 ribosomal RNA small subunit methyltransferase G [Betaproteobacteria bacterium]
MTANSDLITLQDGIAALGLTLPADAPKKLLAYRDMLLKWNRTYNLTALKNPAEAMTHHLLDSLAILPWVFRDQASGIRHQTQGDTAPVLIPDACSLTSVLDVGSGGGLPGIPLAIACPELCLTLTDAVQKKTAFLRQAVIELALAHVEVKHVRVENLQGRYECITSRAFAELKDFVTLTRHLLAPGGRWLAMKGQHPAAEIAALPAGIGVEAVQSLAVPGLVAERHLVILAEGD